MCAKILKMSAYIIGKVAHISRVHSWLRRLYVYVIFKAVEQEIKEFRNENRR